MKIHTYYLLPESGYNGKYAGKEGHYIVKAGNVADLVHDSHMLWGSDYDKRIPLIEELNGILEAGIYPRAAEWDPFTIDIDEYKEMVDALLSIKMKRPYTFEK